MWRIHTVYYWFYEVGIWEDTCYYDKLNKINILLWLCNTVVYIYDSYEINVGLDHGLIINLGLHINAIDNQGQNIGLEPEFIEKLFQCVLEHSRRYQRQYQMREGHRIVVEKGIWDLGRNW